MKLDSYRRLHFINGILFKYKILVGIENTGLGECNKFYVRQLFYLCPIA